MAINSSENQYSYKGRGPLDAKSLVKTYAELLLPETWTVDGVDSAYNGMITAVWLNNTDTSKNGLYFLHDATITSARGKPDVTNEANWHKIGEAADLINYVTNDSLAATLKDYAKANDVQIELAKKADAATIYSKKEIDNFVAELINSNNTVSAKVSENTAKLVGITTTVTQAIEDAIKVLPIATESTPGVIKSGSGANVVSVAEDGTASVQSVNVSTLYQSTGDILVLSGGDTSDANINN